MQSRSGAQTQSRGYTRAVDLWSVGCVSVVLLTGGLAFADPTTNLYSERLAKDCNLTFLEESNEWQSVRRRPKDFVEKLLVLDEAERPTAAEALKHLWFSNEVHRNDFEDLYQRTIRHWHPRPRKPPIVEFHDPAYKYLSQRSQDSSDLGRRFRQRDQDPVDPPYKPFPRNMHLHIWPKRDAKRRLSEEVLEAIENWGPGSHRGLESTGVRASREEREILSAYWSKNEEKAPRSVRARTVSPPIRPRPQAFLGPAETLTGDIMRSLCATAKPAAEEDLSFDIFNEDELVAKDLQDKHIMPIPATPRPQRAGLRRRASSMPPDVVQSRSKSPVSAIPACISSEAVTEGERATTADEDGLIYDAASWATSGDTTSDGPSLTSNDEGIGKQEHAALNMGGTKHQYRLKRRTSTVSTNRQKRRRGSIFDLAEDDENNAIPRRTSTLANRPKTPVANKPKPDTLYLPR